MLFPPNKAAQPKPFSTLLKHLLLQGTEPYKGCKQPVAFPTRSFEKDVLVLRDVTGCDMKPKMSPVQRRAATRNRTMKEQFEF